MKKHLLLILLLFAAVTTQAQIITKEDSLHAGLTAPSSNTVVSGYGEIVYTKNTKLGTATANVPRIITFIGHKFSKNIYFFSEIELENATIGGGRGGELGLEQAFLKFNLSPEYYLTAGLFIPRIGLINENHLPNTYYGNQRPMLETLVIPSTWREIGVGFYASPRSMPGLNLSACLINGLDAQGFSASQGIGGGKAMGNNATARNLALNGAILYYRNNWRLQASGYYGGSVGYSNHIADSLKLQTGTFGTPVSLIEANASYNNKGISFKAIACKVQITKASQINAAFANNTPSGMNGAYAELGYDILYGLSKGNSTKQLIVFCRYENINMAASVPENGIKDNQYNRQYLIAGLNYFPIRSVVIKADCQIMKTGTPNPALITNPFPAAQPYYTNNTFINLGVAYSF